MRNRRWTWRGLGGTVVLAVSVALAAGELDSSFGTGGIVRTPDASAPTDVEVQADGAILVGGGENNAWRVRRYLSDGTLDSGFGTGGAVALFGDPAVTTSNNKAWDLALDANGRILALGQAYVSVTTGSGKKAKTTIVGTCALVRLNADGSLDTTFGSGGTALLLLANQQSSIGVNIAVFPDGRIVVSGRLYLAAGRNAYQVAEFVARFLDNGSPDTTFGSGGKTVHDPTTKDDIVLPHSMGLQSDGRIVVGTRVGGTTGAGLWTVARFMANGGVDSSFQVSNSARILNRIAVDASDRIVAVGTNSGVGDLLLARYLADGSVDTSFGTGGSTSTVAPWGGGAGGSLDPLIRSDGKIVVMVEINPTGAPAQSSTVRFLADGTLDSSYGTGGVGSPVSFAPTHAKPYCADLAPEGSAVLGGFAIGSGAADWFLVRYVGD